MKSTKMEKGPKKSKAASNNNTGKPKKIPSSEKLRRAEEELKLDQKIHEDIIEELMTKMAATRVRDMLEHQLTMLRLARQMNKLMEELKGFESYSSGEPGASTKAKRGKKPKAANLSEESEYVIFSGGPKGLEYISLTQSSTGTFRMEVDVSKYTPDCVIISTENNKTMHVRATVAGVRKTLKIISPEGVNIDDVKIHYPKHGILLLEAP